MESMSGSATASTGASPAATVGTSLSAAGVAVVPVPVIVPDVGFGASANSGQQTTEGAAENLQPPGKRQKKCTSQVWEHYNKYTEIVKAANGAEEVQLWAKCKRCIYKARAETVRGTTAFRNHLEAKHNVNPDQQTLKLVKGEDNTATVLAYRVGDQGMERSELEMFMDETLVPFTEDLDILAWWKNKKVQYPIISQLARDVLAVQVSTVALESAFSAGGRVIDPFRTRLDPEVVEALVCSKDWIAASKRTASTKEKIKIESLIDELDMLELQPKVKEDSTSSITQETLEDDMIESEGESD